MEPRPSGRGWSITLQARDGGRRRAAYGLREPPTSGTNRALTGAVPCAAAPLTGAVRSGALRGAVRSGAVRFDGGALRGRRLDLQALHHLLEPEAREAQELRGARLVAARLLEGLEHQLGLERVHARAHVEPRAARRGGAAAHDVGGQLAHVDRAAVAEH